MMEGMVEEVKDEKGKGVRIEGKKGGVMKVMWRGGIGVGGWVGVVVVVKMDL